MIRRSYQLLMLFAVLSVLGLAMLPRLSVQLAPSKAGRSITVRYSWRGASPEAIERQVSARLEGAFSTLDNVKKVRSVSSYNQGYVTVELDRLADVDALRFELAALVRQVYPRNYRPMWRTRKSAWIPPMSRPAPNPCLPCN